MALACRLPRVRFSVGSGQKAYVVQDVCAGMLRLVIFNAASGRKSCWYRVEFLEPHNKAGAKMLELARAHEAAKLLEGK